MSTAQDLLTEFNMSGKLHFPEGLVPSIRGDAIYTPGRPSSAERIFTFPDGSELLVVQEHGTVKVSLSLAYRVRLALAAKAAAKAAATVTPELG